MALKRSFFLGGAGACAEATEVLVLVLAVKGLFLLGTVLGGGSDLLQSPLP